MNLQSSSINNEDFYFVLTILCQVRSDSDTFTQKPQSESVFSKILQGSLIDR